jgi:hypothetical protein
LKEMDMKKKSPVRRVEAPAKAKANGKALVVVTSPVIREKKRKMVTASDLVEVQDTNLMISIDLKRQPQSQIDAMEINEDQKFFPYSVLPRLMLGWEAVGFISSFELKLSPEQPLPQIVVRFVEKLPAEEIAKLDPAAKAQIETQIARLRQYPFIKIESPLLPLE